jgi:hypothetical protein
MHLMVDGEKDQVSDRNEAERPQESAQENAPAKRVQQPVHEVAFNAKAFIL